MPHNDEYVERLEEARRRKGLTLGELARRSGYPADLVEPLLACRPEGPVSEHMNKELCEALDLDAQEMWRLAHRMRDAVG